jgi:hypothetical protein
VGKLEWEIRVRRLWCRRCDKWAHSSRKAAKKAMNAINDAVPMHVYKCPGFDWWHVGTRKPKGGDPHVRM